MKVKFGFFSVIIFFVNIIALNAQSVFYQHDNSIKVFAYGNEQKLAWCGGFDRPQFTMGDLNHDGLQDLVVFDNWIGVRTFINRGTTGSPNYVYESEYALNFPPIYDFLILADYNCDGIPDLFHRGSYGYSVYTGYYNSLNQLCFTFKQDLYYNNLISGGPGNAYVNPGDIPSIVDVDGDGDLDFVSYSIDGRDIYYYRNMRVEYGLSCDSLLIHLEDQCWGKVNQGYYRTHYLNYNCDNSNLILPVHKKFGEKTTHSGNTPCLFDWDMDGDWDYLDGNVSYSNMTFLKNGKAELSISIDSMVYEDTMWQSFPGGKTIDLQMFPAAFNIDIDQDGKKDLLIASNAAQGSENYKCVWFYKNFSTPGSPSWIFQSDTFFVDQSIDIGSISYPVLFDYNKDGKPDLFVGSAGYFQPSGSLQSRISLYLNTSTPGNTSFTLATNDFNNINSYAFQGAAPGFGDIDNDGKADMIIGHTDGSLSYFTNIATTDAVQPIWQLSQLILTDQTSTEINVGYSATPCIYDVDRDGKPDLVIGNMYGTFVYYQNVSTTAGVIKLNFVNSNLGNVKADPHTVMGNYSTPFIGKVDSTNIEYLMSGSNSGNIYRFNGITSGDVMATYTMLDSSYSFIDTQYSLYSHPGSNFGLYNNLRTAVTVGDIAGDGGKYMIVGNTRGGLELYNLKVHFPVNTNITNSAENGSINIFPNPTTNKINLTWHNILSPYIQIIIVNMEGRVFLNSQKSALSGSCELDVSMLHSGIYVCVLQSGINRYYNKFTVIK